MMDEKIVVNGKTYVLESTIKSPKLASLKGKQYVIARTYCAGVFAGYIVKENGKEMTLANARRIWYWEGAASLSQLSQEGTSRPDKCKFPMEVPEVRLKEVIEILPCSEKARESIAKVAIWKQ